MKVTFYDTLENIESVLTANYGLLLSEEQYLKVQDSVVFQNNKKDRLDTELLNIFFEKDSIYTDKFVIVWMDIVKVYLLEFIINIKE